MKRHRSQLWALAALLSAQVTSVFLLCAFFVDDLAASLGVGVPDFGMPAVMMGLVAAGGVFVTYGGIGVLGYCLAHLANLPGIYNPASNWRRLLAGPMLLGAICGAALVAGEVGFATVNGSGRLPHPPFPSSLFASLNAGIGEEILFRGLVLGLWALVLTFTCKRLLSRAAALWLANGIAALAFGVAHFPALLYLTGAASLAAMNPVLVAEVLLLNALLGLAAGERCVRDGLVAAVGVHFWADVVFHVIGGLAFSMA